MTFQELANFTPKQQEALEALKTHNFVLYGGAGGGGKSYFLRWAALWLLLKWFKQGNKGVRIGIFCEDYPSLHERQTSKIVREFPEYLGHYNSTLNEYTLNPEYGGGVIAFRNLDKPEKYRSSEFAAVLIDELTMNPEQDFHDLRFRMRWPGIQDTKFIGATNPGGKGHGWVKRRWIDREFPPEEREAHQFIYIRALVGDNPFIDQKYLLTLDSLPEAMRRAVRDGDWNIFAGQFFSEWREEVHVIEPFEIPIEWPRYRAIDFGRTAPFAAGWFAVDYDGNVYMYREYYVAGLDANTNFGQVRERSGKEHFEWTVLDSAAFSATYGSSFNRGQGETIADIAWKEGVEVVPSPKNRKHGWVLMHQALRWQEPTENGMIITRPKFFVFNHCANTIRTFPTLVVKKNDPEDLETQTEDHAADMISYFYQHWAGVVPTRPQRETKTQWGFTKQQIQRMKQSNTPSPGIII
jgi:phage terminase large subunit